MVTGSLYKYSEASYTRPSFSAKTSKKLAGRYFFAEETGRVYIFVEETVEKLDEPKREHVLYFLDGNGENWLVEFLDSLTRNSMSKTRKEIQKDLSYATY